MACRHKEGNRTAYTQPTVVDGRVYTGSNDGTVYALDSHSGCIYWMYQAKSMGRHAVVIGPGSRAYFGDLESNFYALDANTGKLVQTEGMGPRVRPVWLPCRD